MTDVDPEADTPAPLGPNAESASAREAIPSAGQRTYRTES